MIYDYDGSQHKISRMWDYDGSEHEINLAWDYDGNTHLIFRRTASFTDLVKWTSWTAANWTSGVNSTSETATVNVSTGIILYRPAPGIGYNNPGQMTQTISLTNGHKYWVAFGGYSLSDGPMYWNVPGNSGTQSSSAAKTYSNIYSATSTANFTITFKCNTSNSDGSYCRVSYCTVVDLTAAMGVEVPTAAWCVNNIGVALNGSKTVTINY